MRCAQIVHSVRAYNESMDRSKLVVVDRFASQAEADLAMSELESAGIDAMIQADRAGGMRDHLAWSGLGFKVLVREEDAPIAREVLTPPHGSGLVVVQTFGTQAEADRAQGALLSAGIGATIQDDSATGWRPDVAWSCSGFRLLVREEDVATAREMLNSPQEAGA